ncbi:MAG: hypothetical protein P8129_11580, partial [Anaerolineae bacterium]
MKKYVAAWLVLFTLVGMMVPLTSLARMVGAEFTLYGNAPLRSYSGGVAYEGSQDRYVAGLLLEEVQDGWLQPYVMWYGLDDTWDVPRQLMTMTAGDSTAPEVSCAPGYTNGDCLAVWTANGKVYARRVTPYEWEWGPTRTIVDLPGFTPVASTVAPAGWQTHVIVSDSADGQIHVQEIDYDVRGDSALVQKPVACSKLYFPSVAVDAATETVAVAFGCFDEGTAYVQLWNFSSGATLISTLPLVAPGGQAFAPKIATDGNGQFLAVWGVGAFQQRVYAQRFDIAGHSLGSVFPVYPDDDDQEAPSVTYDAVNGEYLVLFEHEYDVYYVRLMADGASVGPAYAVTTATGRQSRARAAYGNSRNRYLITWTDRGSSGTEVVRGRWVEPEKILDPTLPQSSELPAEDSGYYQAAAQMNQWQALGLRPSLAGDLDVYLYDAPDYVTLLASSANGSGQVDVVVMDGRQSDLPAYFAEVRPFAGDTFYHVGFSPTVGRITQGQNVIVDNLAPEAVVRMYEV